MANSPIVPMEGTHFAGPGVPLLHFWNTWHIAEHADYQVFHFWKMVNIV